MERQTAINYYKSKGLKKITPVSITIGADHKNPVELHERDTAFWGNVMISFGQNNTTPVTIILTLEDDAEILRITGTNNYESYYIAFDKIVYNPIHLTGNTFITFQGLQFKK